jgi:gliding motility-associated-like protein
MKKLLFILSFLPFSAFSQIQYIEACTENQEYLQEYWVDNPIPSIYQWTVQGGIIVNGQGTYTITVNWLNIPYGQYNINVSVISNTGCIGNDVSLTVDVDECSFDDVYVPNCFTVNNDNINDQWGPVFNGDWDDSAYSMLVFNRWGGIVWEGHHPLERWDGTHKGRLCVDGVYIWKMECKRLNTIVRETKHGHVTLLK